MAYKITDEQVLQELYEYTIKSIPVSCTDHYIGGEYGLCNRTFGGVWAARASSKMRIEMSNKYNVSEQTILNSFKRLAKKGFIQEYGNGSGSCHQHWFNDELLMKIRDFTLEIMNKQGLTEKPQSFEQMELVWAETSDELRKLISLEEVIETSMKGGVLNNGLQNNWNNY